MPFFFLVGFLGALLGLVAIFLVGTANLASHIAAHLAFWMGMLIALVTHGFERAYQNQKAVLAVLQKITEIKGPHD